MSLRLEIWEEMKESSRMEHTNFLHLRMPKLEELGDGYQEKGFLYNPTLEL